LSPGYEHAVIPTAGDDLAVIASGHGDGAVHVHQDVRLLAGRWSRETMVRLPMDDRQAWIQIIDGELTVNGELLNAGDGLGVRHAAELDLRTAQTAHFLVFELRPTA
jgi:redox-sensitive bicupin YhaK (pirin superfamily)